MFKRYFRRLHLFRHGLSAPLKEELYDAGTGAESKRIVHSAFNPQWLGQLGITPKAIVEFGAYDGGDALRFSRDFPDCRVITVEADPERFAAVEENLAGTSVEVKNLAVCEKDEPIDWYAATIDGDVEAQGSIYQHTDAYKTRFPFVNQQESPTQVQGTRVDSLCADLGVTEIDLLHMDIEGAEYAALKSLGDIRPKVVFAEIGDNRFVGASSAKDVHALFAELGYRLIVDLDPDCLYVHASVLS